MREKPEWAKESIISKAQKKRTREEDEAFERGVTGHSSLAAWIIEKCEM